MKKAILGLALVFLSAPVLAQSSDSDATAASQSQSGAGATAATGSITFEGSQAHRSQRLHTTPTIYTPPSMFGGANNCGQSSALGVGVTGFGIGGSLASESDNCNAREDTSISYKLGYKDVADMRFFCFGEDLNRMAYEAAGHSCPEGATAKGLASKQQATQRRVATGQSGAANPSLTSDQADRAQAMGYSGSDPVVMKRLGIIQ